MRILREILYPFEAVVIKLYISALGWNQKGWRKENSRNPKQCLKGMDM